MNRFWRPRWAIWFVMMAALLLGVSGCAGGARAKSWTGLAVVGEKLYASDVEQARAMNATNSETVWTFPKNPKDANRGVFHSSPVVGDGRVFVTSQRETGGFFSERENIIWALDAETGAEIWRFEDASGRYVEAGALSGDTLVVGNGDGNVYALDAEDGSLKWTFETGHRVWATPLIVSDTVYIGSMDRHVYALDLTDGKMQWEFHTDGAFASRPALHEGTLYIGAFDDRFYAIDAQNGTEQWHYQGEDWFWGSPVVYSDTVYAADVRGDVYALDTESGEVAWQKALEAPVRAGPTLSEDKSKLFIGAENGTLYALEVTDEFIEWTDESEGRVLSSPVVSGSVVYKPVLYGTHRIRALQVEDGREVWAYPEVEEEE